MAAQWKEKGRRRNGVRDDLGQEQEESEELAEQRVD